ncbi:MAG TPA: hypothetical protein V6D26_10030, partial [Stenomitos sp.]
TQDTAGNKRCYPCLNHIVNKLGILGGSLPGKTPLASGFGGACRPLNSSRLDPIPSAFCYNRLLFR